MATPETSNRSPIALKNQLQVALAAAIGPTAGAILWEAIFLHEIGSLIEEIIADWIRVILLGGSITLAWAPMVCHALRSARGTTFGAGAIVGGAFDLGIFGSSEGNAVQARRGSRSRSTRRFSICLAGDSPCGFLGGLAIERGWGSRSAIRVALGVRIAGVVASLHSRTVRREFHDHPFLGRQVVGSSYVLAGGHWG